MPEGCEAKARPERLQVRSNRPGAVVASEEHRRGDRRRRLPNDRTPHPRQPCHHRARDDTVQKDMTPLRAFQGRPASLPCQPFSSQRAALS